MLQCCHMVVW